MTVRSQAVRQRFPLRFSQQFLGHEMAMRGIRFEAGDGIVMENAEDTVKAVGYMGKNGMKQTDVEILNLMIGKTKLS